MASLYIKQIRAADGLKHRVRRLALINQETLTKLNCPVKNILPLFGRLIVNINQDRKSICVPARSINWSFPLKAILPHDRIDKPSSTSFWL